MIHKSSNENGRAELPSEAINESNESNEEASDEPIIPENLDTDILCGRGDYTNKHPGNIAFRQFFTEERVKIYGTLSIMEKNHLSNQTYDKFIENGMRFLTKQGIGWVVTPRKIAVTKIGQMYRERLLELNRGDSSNSDSAMEIDEDAVIVI